MPRLIIIEGPDGAGKTVLAMKLRELGYKYVHHGPPTPEEARDMLRAWVQQLLKAHSPTVFDRLHLSERIYGPLTRGRSAATVEQETLLERASEAMDAQVVVALPTWRTVLNNWVKNKKDELIRSAGDMRAVYDAYAGLLQLDRPYIRYDYTRHEVGGFAKALVNIQGYSLPYGVIGSQRPRFLVLTVGGASPALNARLREAGFVEGEMAFAGLGYRPTDPRLAGLPRIEVPDDECLPSAKALAHIRRSAK
jgi:hypothetical protein